MEDNKIENKENISEFERIMRLPSCGERVNRYLDDEIQCIDSSQDANMDGYVN